MLQRRGTTRLNYFLSPLERKRERLEALKCLRAATARTVEIFEGRVAVFLHDKALLDEEDILPATFLLVFGKEQRSAGAPGWLAYVHFPRRWGQRHRAA